MTTETMKAAKAIRDETEKKVNEMREICSAVFAKYKDFDVMPYQIAERKVKAAEAAHRTACIAYLAAETESKLL